MRRRSIWLARGFVAAALAVPARPVQAQFNPEGRRPTASTPGNRAPRGPAAKPRPAAKRTPPVDDGRLRERYRRVVLSQPDEAFPRQRLVELYRKRDGGVERLVEEFSRLGDEPGPSQYAALVALAGIQAGERRWDEARALYARAQALAPDTPEAWLALAQLEESNGAPTAAYDAYARALPLLSNPVQEESTQRALMHLALDQGRFEDAATQHRALVTRSKGSLFVQGELGRELIARGQFERAIAELDRVARASAGDRRAQGPALKDLGVAQMGAQRYGQAQKTLERAAALTPAGSGTRREIYVLLADAYRRQGRIAELVSRLESEPTGGGHGERLLAELYEETGRLEAATRRYREILRRHPTDIDLRLRLIRLLEVQGLVDDALVQLRALVGQAPQSAKFVFQLVTALLQRGERAEALHHLRKLEARSHDDEDVLASLIDFYDRLGHGPHARALQERLASSRLRDPIHLVDLGRRYWQAGDTDRARATWERLRGVPGPRGHSLLELGRAYLDHDLQREAIATLREALALDPASTEHARALALALERVAATATSRRQRSDLSGEAQRLWEQLLLQHGDDARLARQARQQIVGIWRREGSLERRLAPLGRRLARANPDLDAGRLLAEALLKLQRPREAAAALRRVVTAAPGDLESWRRLEIALGEAGAAREALDVLRQLIDRDPRRSREYYERMAELATGLYDDDLALELARRAVASNAGDASARARLAALLAARGEFDEAIAAYRGALAQNPRDWSSSLKLSELLVARQQLEPAQRLLARVIAACPDDPTVERAGRASLRIHSAQGTEEQLERRLLPLALGEGSRQVYRKLLLELYAGWAAPWSHRLETQPEEATAEERERLKAVAERATKPLLDILYEGSDAERRLSLRLLSQLAPPSAASGLLGFAQGSQNLTLRLQAMSALVGVAGPSVLPELSKLVARPQQRAALYEAEPLRAAATRTIALLACEKSRGTLVELLDSDDPRAAAWAAIGLELVGAGPSEATLLRLMRDATAHPQARAAAVFALRGEPTRQDEALLLALAASDRPMLSRQALLALGRARSGAAATIIAQGLLSSVQRVRRDARDAALLWAGAEAPRLTRHERASIAAPGDYLLLATRIPQPREASLRALVALSDALAQAVGWAARSSPEEIAALVGALDSHGAHATFNPLLGNNDSSQSTPATEALEVEARTELLALAKRATSEMVRLAQDARADTKLIALRYLVGQRSPEALAVVRAALGVADEHLQRALLVEIGRRRATLHADTVAQILERSPAWAVREQAARTLGQLAHHERLPSATPRLTHAALEDPMAFTREAALRALLDSDPSAARGVLLRAARHDPEPSLQQTAESLLRSAP